MKFPILVCWLLVLVFGARACAQSRYPVAVGEVHPDFQLMDVETSGPVSLSDYRGKKVLLIHFASW